MVLIRFADTLERIKEDKGRPAVIWILASAESSIFSRVNNKKFELSTRIKNLDDWGRYMSRILVREMRRTEVKKPDGKEVPPGSLSSILYNYHRVGFDYNQLYRALINVVADVDRMDILPSHTYIKYAEELIRRYDAMMFI